MSAHSAPAALGPVKVDDEATAGQIGPSTRRPKSREHLSLAAITTWIVLSAAALATAITVLVGASAQMDRPVTPRPSPAASPQP